MDERECARRLAVSLSYLRNGRCKLKGPPYVKLGGRAVRYRECDVEAWIAEHIVAPVA
jgi:predicted DNA-binding transcriptional regulator AlpA